MFRYVKYLIAVLLIVMLIGITSAQGDLDNDGLADDIDPQTLISSSAALLSGEYNFQNLTITNNAVLTLNSNTSFSGFKGVKISANNLIIDSGSAISTDGLGYLANQGPGTAVWNSVSGGGYGGRGGGGANGGGPTYGSALIPTDLGSGGNAAPGEGSGGGAIKLNISDTLTLEGKITANGSNSGHGCGSGGSIYVITNHLGGSGTFAAGGASGTGAGGGGRIAIYSKTSTFSGIAETKGGLPTYGSYPGGEDGTVVFIDTVNNILTTGPSFAFQENDGPFNFNTIALRNSKVLSRGNVTITAGDIELKNSTFTSGGITGQITSSGFNMVDSSLSMTNASKSFTVQSLTLNNSTILVGGESALQTDNLMLSHHSLLTTLSQVKINLLLQNLTIDADSAISTDGLGYLANQGPGTAVWNSVSGGGYGGRGGGGANGGGPTYGSALIPTDLGSGGNAAPGEGSGGGAIKLNISDTLTLEGKITANGSNSGHGCGSGGSIYVITNHLGGSGTFAAGGASGTGAGGGGRIAIYSKTSTFSGIAETKGGLPTYGSYPGGEDGTVVYNPTILPTNQPTQGIVLPYQNTVFYFNATENNDLIVRLTPSLQSDEFELYAKHDDMPSKSNFDFFQNKKNPQGSYDLVISPTIAGQYIFSVNSKNTIYSANFTIQASINSQYVSNVYPKSLTPFDDSRLTIYGTGFVQGMRAEIRNNNITLLPAKWVITSSSTVCSASFNLSGFSIGQYDLAIIYPDNHEELFSSVIKVSDFGPGVLYENRNVILSSGITQNFSFDMPRGENLFITLQKVQYQGDPHWNWYGQMSLSHNGQVIASSQSNQDQIIHVVNPEPGNYILSITSPEQGTGILTVLTELPQMPDGKWVVDPIYRPYGSTFHQVVVPPGPNSLIFNAEAIGGWSHFNVYYGYWGSNQHWISSNGPDASLSIPNPRPGLYLAEFVDTQMITGKDQKREVMLKVSTNTSAEPQPVYFPIITAYSPIKGGNTGTVTMEIKGSWLDPNASVSLNQNGNPVISPLSVNGSPNKESLVAVFDLSQKSIGSYTVTVTNPDGTNVSGSNPFVIETGGRSEFWTQITGRDKIRIGTPSTFILQYGNKGNLDMPAPMAVITSDPASTHLSTRILPNGTWKQMGTDGLTLKLPGPVENPDILPAGSSYTMELQIQTDLSEEFTLNVVPHGGDQVYSPVTLELGTDMAVPGPGLPLMFNRAYPARLSSYSGAMGTGWVHTYDFRLIPIEDGSLGIRSGDIIKTTFSRQDDGSWTDESGNTKITVNPDDGTFTASSIDGSMIKFDPQGLPVRLSDANGNQITLTYTGGKLSQVQHSDGDVLTLSYNGNNRINSVSGPGGQITSYTYSPDGMLLTQVTDTDGRVTQYSYQLNGLGYAIASITRPGNIVENYQYDGDGRLIGSSLNGQKEAVSIQYDENSRSTTIIDSTGSSVGIQVNERGQVVRQENALGEANQFTYDARGNLTAMADASGNEYQFEHDTSGQVTSITDPLSHVTRYTYDPQIQSVKTITDPRGNTLSFNYDSRSNIIGVMYPDTRSETMSHDSAGNLVTFTSRRGDNLQYTYNSRGQLTRAGYPDGKSVTYTYDTLGNLMEISSTNGSIAINFNSRNELIHVSYPGGIFFNYTYDSAGRLIEREDKEGLGITYAYDDLGHLLSVGDTSGMEYAHYSYDPTGRISRKTIGNGAYATYAYDTPGRISSLINFGTDGTILSRFDYQYDASGNPVQIGTLEGNYLYKYDALGQLTEVTFPDNSKEHYTYDAAGNRISTTIVGTITSYSTNNMNQYTQAGSESFTYDNNGNLVSRNGNGTTTYDYNYENQLTRVTSPEGTWDYTYDALGNRVVVDNNGTITRYAVDPFGLGMIAAEYYENGTLESKYVYGLGLVAKTTGNDVYYYDFNPTGHTSEITNKMGSVVNRYQYTPFGSYRQKIEGISNPFTYAGENGVMDDANGLYYMRLRYYLPNLGVFISEDPSASAGGNLNTYSYNNPVLYSDPFGLDSHKETVWKFVWGEVLTKSISKLEKDVAKLKKWHKAYSQDNKFLKGAKSCEEGLGGLELSIDAYNLGTTIADAQIGKKNKWNILQDTFKVGGDVVDLVGSPLVKAVKKSAEFGWAVGRILGRTPLLTDPSMTYDQFYQELFSKMFFKKVASVTSIDPEDKYGPTGYDSADTSKAGRQRFIPATDQFSYRVEFWNAETATANVNDVSAYDHLDSHLNTSSFGFTEVGFTNWSVPLDGAQTFDVYVYTRPTMNYIVHITGDMNPATGNVTLEYHTLDADTLKPPADPVAGFLPPISSSGKEIGWFAYTVQPKQGLSTGTIIDNQAFINFDYSQFMPAPKDAPWHNTIDTGAPSTSVSATVINQNEIQFTLSGSDDSGGSGIKDYTIYGSDNGGAYSPYLNHISSTTCVISGIPDHTYRFFSIARDNIGNTEPLKSQPDATIFIPIPISAPIAWFTASPAKGPSPLTVNFTDQSDNNPTAWNWNFGDGSAWINGTTQKLTHTYTVVGNYTATLIVSNSAGQDRIQRTITVTNKGLLPLPGFTNPPTDPDGDGLYEDLNANNRKDFNDVVLMFNHMQWIAANEPSGAFDFDFNANGRIDFNDIVKLFGEI